MKAPTRETGILTVAAIRRHKGEVEYLFNEKERIFTLPRIKASEATAKLLQDSFKKRVPFKATLDTREPLIHKVVMPREHEIREFARLRTLLENPARPVRIDVDSIDPTTFNIVDRYLKFPCFRLCRRVIPNYKKAKAIFDFCAKQSCNLPGPKSVSPCIPFQYVRDGCYARAHKMRWIITRKYHYCCDKVFSFAINNFDRLAVRADKWGGCCVTWWYHVAPLVRVRIGRLGVLAMVIDPGMFNKPVLLSSWLAAQENKACNPNAHVSKYTIQPGSAYTPANGQGTAFTTDPFYTATDATLTLYKNLTTCP